MLNLAFGGHLALLGGSKEREADVGTGSQAAFSRIADLSVR